MTVLVLSVVLSAGLIFADRTTHRSSMVNPDLRQVVAQTVEAGMRGRQSVASGGSTVQWNLGVFRTDSHDDIMLLATPINGFGYYNIGSTGVVGSPRNGDLVARLTF